MLYFVGLASDRVRISSVSPGIGYVFHLFDLRQGAYLVGLPSDSLRISSL